ncbi:MAG: hypothetical protein M8350_08680 [Methanosarcinaceae archaeon]|nr:hypothetical protein [Methanosarcinaceae archaeon]
MVKNRFKTLERFSEMGGRAKATLLIIGLLAVGFIAIIGTQALFEGSHTLYTNKSNSSDMCIKCHPDQVSTTMVSSHQLAGCICHGYNPSANPTQNINLAHNMTKQIYCTNCHSNYDSNGDITIYSGVSGLNQSGHYITNDTTVLYNHSKTFFS